MALSNDLISQFVKATSDKKKDKKEETVYGTVVVQGDSKYVKLDGSDQLTPISTTADTKNGERVVVLIKNHTATVTGNISSPAARTDDVMGMDSAYQDLADQISEFEIVIADKVSTKDFDAATGRIDDLQADNVLIKDRLIANEADISELSADNATIKERLTANEASIENLETTKLDASIAEITYATIENLDTTNANVYNLQSTYGEFKDLTTEKLSAVDASIKDLEATKLSAVEADLKYANIDFSNIGKAAMEYFYANSGLIEDVIVGDGTITGNLVGVTISGDLIEGNTIKADKLVIKGEDGLYYKLNTNGVTTEAEQTEYNSLNGTVILAKSITASKISVDDLVAFDATIGGFNITNNSIYSGVKESVDNTTRGIYLDSDGQMAIGDSNNFIKYYRDQNGEYKLEISAKSMTLSTSGKSVETAISDMQEEVSNLKDEITTLLRIESSRGTVFKNDTVATVLSVVIYHGTQRITDSATMKSVFGNGAYLQWKWQRLDDEAYGVISSSDTRFGDNGFTFTLSPGDVDTKVTFMCELIV